MVDREARLNAIMERLGELEEYGDVESQHMEADTLLLDVIDILAGPEDRDDVEIIRFQYNAVHKWYA